MTRLNVIRFEKEHLQQMTLLSDERDVIMKNADFLQFLSESQPMGYQSVFCGTAYWGEKILCVGGWFAQTPGTCQLFIIPDAEMIRLHPSVFARTTIKWRKKVEDFCRYQRIQAVALPGLADWMKVIGFEFEQLLPNYNDTGKDYELWGKQL